MKKGFTLIELLVVVLIIGILAAIALPQYQKAVKKSRIAGVFANLKTLQQAGEACVLAKGSSCAIEDMDIEGFSPEIDTYTDCTWLFTLYGHQASVMCGEYGGELSFILTEEGKRGCCGHGNHCPDYGFDSTLPSKGYGSVYGTCYFLDR